MVRWAVKLSSVAAIVPEEKVLINAAMIARCNRCKFSLETALTKITGLVFLGKLPKPSSLISKGLTGNTNELNYAGKLWYSDGDNLKGAFKVI